MNHIGPLNLEDLDRIEKGFSRLVQRSCSILLFDSSHIMGLASLRNLKTSGYQNIVSVDSKISNVEELLKARKFRLVILDGDMKDNECFKYYL